VWALARSCEGRLREFRDQNCVQVSNFGVISICGASLEFCGEDFFGFWWEVLEVVSFCVARWDLRRQSRGRGPQT
jgi:hypothetical protein